MSSAAPADQAQRPSRKWRVIDIVVASALAIVCGVVFWAWNIAYEIPSAALEAVIPGLSGLTAAPWLFAGVLGGLVIRKPGAALYVGVVAALLSMLFGAKWGTDTLLSGILQGLGAEIVFAAFAYRYYGVLVAMLAGAAAAALEIPHQMIVWYSEMSFEWQLIYSISMLVSGAIIAGIGAWLIMKVLVVSGALDRFAAGRDRVARI